MVSHQGPRGLVAAAFLVILRLKAFRVIPSKLNATEAYLSTWYCGLRHPSMSAYCLFFEASARESGQFWTRANYDPELLDTNMENMGGIYSRHHYRLVVRNPRRDSDER